jgi:hypothetical protein
MRAKPWKKKSGVSKIWSGSEEGVKLSKMQNFDTNVKLTSAEIACACGNNNEMKIIRKKRQKNNATLVQQSR